MKLAIALAVLVSILPVTLSLPLQTFEGTIIPFPGEPSGPSIPMENDLNTRSMAQSVGDSESGPEKRGISSAALRIMAATKLVKASYVHSGPSDIKAAYSAISDSTAARNILNASTDNIQLASTAIFSAGQGNVEALTKVVSHPAFADMSASDVRASIGKAHLESITKASSKTVQQVWEEMQSSSKAPGAST